MRILFMGSPAEVVPALDVLAQAADSELIGVVAQPARPAGRNQRLTDPPIVEAARQRGLSIYQPPRVSAPEALQQIAEWAPDVAITAAYGQLLSRDFLAIPRRATINIHPSLLPAYRGATPVQAALLDGVDTTGVTILFTVEQLDAGPIIAQESVAIGETETTADLLPRLFERGAELLPSALAKLRDPQFTGTPQDPALVTHCHKFDKAAGRIDWQRGVREIVNRHRAFQPWPGSYTFLGDDGPRYIILDLGAANHRPEGRLHPGTIRWDGTNKQLLVDAGDGAIEVRRARLPSGKIVEGPNLANALTGHPQTIFS